MVKKVFYAEKEKFLRSMMELALRAKKAEIYTVEGLKDNFYLIDDLKPDLVIFDLADDPASIQKLYEYSNQTKLVATGPVEAQNSLDKRVSGFLSRPIEAKNLAERVLSLVD